MDPQIIETPNSLEQAPTNKRAFPILLIVVLIIATLGLSTAVVVNKNNSSNNKNNGQINPEDSGQPVKLISDPSSVNTIIYGYKESEKLVNINAVNDSSINNGKIAIITEGVKSVIPLKNKKQFVFISGIPDTIEGGDKGTAISVKNIVPTVGGKDGKTITLHKATDDYKIDSLIISENNEWISWSENKPPKGLADLHTKNFFRSFKAKIGSLPITESSKISPILLTNEKSDTDVNIRLPAIITNSGFVYFNGIRPTEYFIHNGITDEANQTIIPVNAYNSKPTLNQERYLLFTSFNPNNNPLLPAGNTTSARLEVLNRNSIKVLDLQNPTTPPVVVAPGDKGEHYNHPAYISGTPDTDFRLVTEVFAIEKNKLVLKSIQTIKRLGEGSFEKKTIVEFPKEENHRILAVGQKPNGNKTVIVGKEGDTGGSLGSGWSIGSSGYQKMLTSIKVYDIDSNDQQIPMEIKLPSTSEFLGIMEKSPTDKIGIDVNDSLPTLIDRNQLQLETFIPVEPKRQGSNPRSVCEKEWKEKGYPNYEACEACPLYVYSNIPQEVSVKPVTPISTSSAVPSLINGIWNFVADKEGDLLFTDKSVHKRIDFLFPRGTVEKPATGIIIQRNNYEAELVSYAKSLGFNERESKDVLEFFLPQIKNSKYIFLSTLSKEETKKILDFEVSPMPKVQETRMFYIEKLEKLPEVKPQKPVFSPFARSSYSVVTWGGMVK